MGFSDAALSRFSEDDWFSFFFLVGSADLAAKRRKDPSKSAQPGIKPMAS